MLPFKHLFFIFCLCGLFLSGCGVGSLMSDSSETHEKRQPPPAKVMPRDVVTPALTSINNRIYTYEQKVAEWREVERRSASTIPQEKLNRLYECTSQLQDILTGYNTFRNRLLQGNRTESAQLLAGDSLLQLNQQDIDYLEGGCSRLLVELKTTPQ